MVKSLNFKKVTKKENSNNSIIPIGSTGLVRVGNSIEITSKIIREHEERVINKLFPTTKIGSQIWMTNNLDVDCYANGDQIPEVQNPIEWENLKTGAWCYYNNNPEDGKRLGKIYNWYALNDPRGLAPEGFKIASIEDWKVLFDFLGENIAGYKLKSISGWKENGNGSNEFEMNILPAGYRMYNIFIGKDDYTHIWTSTEKNEKSAVFVNFNHYGDNVFSSDTFKYTGSYVRCLKLH